jgi:predicted DNA-binding transcriptional regulator YafY
MATNKLAVIRYNTLDRCFSNFGRRFFIDDLIDACNKSIQEFTGTDVGIKRRQIFEDIKFMESPQGWNISLQRLRDGQKVYYRYEDRTFSINNSLLNDAEKKQLKETLDTLSRFKGLPQFDWIPELSARLDAQLYHKNSIIQFDQNTYLKGLDFITPIYHAISFYRVVNIQYQSFKVVEEQSFTLHPYFLKQYNNRWYVFGLNDYSKRMINLALDRITDITELQLDYIPNTNIDFDNYFEDVIGVSVSDTSPAQQVLLEISNQLLPYITTKPLHGSQKTYKKNSETSIIELNVKLNYELESTILSYGEKAFVMAPVELREKLAARIAELNSKYLSH